MQGIVTPLCSLLSLQTGHHKTRLKWWIPRPGQASSNQAQDRDVVTPAEPHPNHMTHSIPQRSAGPGANSSGVITWWVPVHADRQIGYALYACEGDDRHVARALFIDDLTEKSPR